MQIHFSFLHKTSVHVSLFGRSCQRKEAVIKHILNILGFWHTHISTCINTHTKWHSLHSASVVQRSAKEEDVNCCNFFVWQHHRN